MPSETHPARGVGGEPGTPDPGGSGSDAQAAGFVESLYYLVLLLCTSANLGSGVSGGRCGLTTSLNQASC